VVRKRGPGSARASWLRDDVCVDCFAKGVAGAWSDEAEEARAGFRETFRARRDHLLRLIDSELGLKAVTPEGAFYTMLDVSKYGRR
jgi:aspartate/methionine/tyrosine aminotransferase